MIAVTLTFILAPGQKRFLFGPSINVMCVPVHHRLETLPTECEVALGCVVLFLEIIVLS